MGVRGAARGGKRMQKQTLKLKKICGGKNISFEAQKNKIPVQGQSEKGDSVIRAAKRMGGGEFKEGG